MGITLSRIGRRGAVATIGTAAALAAGALALPAGASAAKCKHESAKNEPPCNPALANSPWGASHRGSYAQASSPYKGLESKKVKTIKDYTPGIPIQLQFSDRYPHGGRVAWGSVVSSNDNQSVFKVNAKTGKLIDTYTPSEREQNPPPAASGSISGSYNMLDRNDHFIVPRNRFIDVYGEQNPDKVGSKITLLKRYFLPDSAFCTADDHVVGATMTYDGYVAMVSEYGVVSTVPRKPHKMNDENLRTYSINGSACDTAPQEDLENVSNSIAADEKGGIYVVTSKKMRKVKHDPKTNELHSAWAAKYNAGSEQSAVRLGEGSGSTPSLMGVGKQDKFVVITDGQDVMHQDLFWRGGVPKKWKGLGGDHPKRMACETPVTFGDPNTTASLSEQSVAVRGYGTLNVQNLIDYDFGSVTGPLRSVLAALRGGDPSAAPHGAERIDWKPGKQKCVSKWANKKVSIPNGIPTMSSKSKLAYGIAQKGGEWGVAGLDWKTGKEKFFARSQQQACDLDEAHSLLEQGGVDAIFGPVLDELPNDCSNSTYAATEVGPGGSIWTGNFLGLTIYRPKG